MTLKVESQCVIEKNMLQECYDMSDAFNIYFLITYGCTELQNSLQSLKTSFQENLILPFLQLSL